VVSGEWPEIEVANTPNDLKRKKPTDLTFALQTTFAGKATIKITQ